MGLWLGLATGLLGTGAVAYFRGRERARIERLAHQLHTPAAPAIGASRNNAALDGLPDPVARYFRSALEHPGTSVAFARLKQSGVLRTGTASHTWLTFTAEQHIAPPQRSFLWDCRVRLPFALPVRVVDAYVDGTGSGHVSLLATLPLADETGGRELNAGALHRYLAEAVWCPPALLPQAGVQWEPVDERCALAHLSDHTSSVSLQFWFGARGDIVGVYTPARLGRFGGAYRSMPWEGHFRHYGTVAGMRIPRYGEVGWHNETGLQLVWKGTIEDARYTFA